LLDEPCASLDWRSQREILTLIQELHNRLRLTTLMVTHDLNSLPEVSTRIAFMKEGRLIWEGDAAQALSASRLTELYGTRITITSHGGKPVLLY
jgi:ABC-type cobalamin/Fe3+-siderophores transport system ATPase subunit